MCLDPTNVVEGEADAVKLSDSTMADLTAKVLSGEAHSSFCSS